MSGGFILSGDAAIYEYENGVIRDEKHHLKLLQYTFTGGNPQRLTSVLSEIAEYYSEITDKYISGKNEVIKHIQYVQDNTPHKYFAYMAEVLDTDSNTKNEKCIVLASDQKDNYESLVFIEQDEEGNIQKISVRDTKHHRFLIDNTDKI